MRVLDYHTTPLDPARTDLAREFRARPSGVHSPELQVLLNRMRSLPVDGKHVLITVRPGEEWMLGQIYREPPRVRRLPEHRFHSVEAAEWFVFKLRWRALCGEELCLEEDEEKSGEA